MKPFMDRHTAGRLRGGMRFFRAAFLCAAFAFTSVTVSSALPAVNAAASHSSSAVRSEDVRVVFAGPSTARRVALTFDDGPRPGVTDRILDLLDEARVHATFFVVGQRVVSSGERGRGLLRRMRDEGHEIGNHSYTHGNIARMGVEALRREVVLTSDAVEAACGVRPRLFRPPGGGIDFGAVRSLASTEIEGVVLWSIDPSDWTDQSREITWQRISDSLHPGAVILLHDTHEETLRALPLLLDLIQARGFEIVTVSELIGMG